MAREEEIKKALSKPFKSFGGDVNYKMGFEDGVIWANAHPQASKINKEIKNNKTELLPIMQAFAEGKEIETLDTEIGWVITEDPTFKLSPKYYRIKPEPQYRPFESQEECWNEMLKHQQFGWIKSIKKQEKEHIGRVFDTPDNVLITLSINEGLNYSSSYLFDNYTFDDGTPFGIKMEE